METLYPHARARLASSVLGRRAQSLAAAAVLLALLITSTASAHYYISYTAVSGRRIAYVDYTKYDYARSHAVGAWNVLGEVTIAPATGGETVDLKWADVYRSDVSWWGYYAPYSGSDLVLLNKYWLDKYYVGLTSEKAVAAHELGHALGLWHNPDSTQLMNACPACPDGSLMTTPRWHDSSDYYWRWP